MIQPDDLGAWWQRLFDDRALRPELPLGQPGSGALRTADCGRIVSQETALEGVTLLLHRYSEALRIAFVLIQRSRHQGWQAIPLRSRCAPSSRPARWERTFRRIKDIASRSATINPLDLQHFSAGGLASIAIVLAERDDDPPSLDMPSLRLFAQEGRNLRIKWPDTVTCALPDHLIACLDWLRSDREFATLDILSTTEKQRLAALEAPDLPCPDAGSPLVGIQRAVLQYHDFPALISERSTLSFADLGGGIAATASTLQAIGVTPGDRIALAMTASESYVIALLATLWIGAVAVPADASAPPAYTRDQIRRLGVRLVVTETADLARTVADLAESHVLDLSSLGSGSALGPPVPRADDAHLYIVHTSGSSGTPKAVPIRYCGCAALCAWYAQALEPAREGPVLVSTPVTFDLTMKNIFAPLASGRAIVIANSAERQPLAMLHLIKKHRISVWNGTPSAFNPLLALSARGDYRDLQSLRLVFLGGEALSAGPLREWRSSPHMAARIVNLYGPTECTDLSVGGDVCGDLETDDDLSIGRPIVAARVYVLDGLGRRQPIGVEGELCIGGRGVAEGYIGAPRESEPCFVPDILAGSGAIMYRTGDRALWRQDGRLSFRGRVDLQVKVRGMRLELGEVERHLAAHADIVEVAVVAGSVGANSDDRHEPVSIVAHIVTADRRLSASDISRWLRDRLPEHMVPAIVAADQALPRTRHGKIDRKALAARRTFDGPAH
jgi:iturin family lipopeptide synthetase A